MYSGKLCQINVSLDEHTLVERDVDSDVVCVTVILANCKSLLDWWHKCDGHHTTPNLVLLIAGLYDILVLLCRPLASLE